MKDYWDYFDDTRVSLIYSTLKLGNTWFTIGDFKR